MILAAIIFFSIGLLWFVLLRLDRSYKTGQPPQLGWLAFREDAPPAAQPPGAGPHKRPPRA